MHGADEVWTEVVKPEEAANGCDVKERMGQGRDRVVHDQCMAARAREARGSSVRLAGAAAPAAAGAAQRAGTGAVLAT